MPGTQRPTPVDSARSGWESSPATPLARALAETEDRPSKRQSCASGWTQRSLRAAPNCGSPLLPVSRIGRAVRSWGSLSGPGMSGLASAGCAITRRTRLPRSHWRPWRSCSIPSGASTTPTAREPGSTGSCLGSLCTHAEGSSCFRDLSCAGGSRLPMRPSQTFGTPSPQVLVSSALAHGRAAAMSGPQLSRFLRRRRYFSWPLVSRPRAGRCAHSCASCARFTTSKLQATRNRRPKAGSGSPRVAAPPTPMCSAEGALHLLDGVLGADQLARTEAQARDDQVVSPHSLTVQ